MARRGQARAGAARPASSGGGGGAPSGPTSRPRAETAPGQASSAPAAKRQKGKKKKEGVEQQQQSALVALLPMMAKLILQNVQLARDLASAIFATFFLLRTAATAKSTKAAMVKYDEDTKAHGDQGPPHLHAVLGFLEGAKSLAYTAEEEELKDQVTQFDKEFEEASEEEQHRMVPFFRLRRIQKQEVWLLQYRTSAETTDSLFRAVLKKEAAVPKSGRAPAGVMERLLSRALKELEVEEEAS